MTDTITEMVDSADIDSAIRNWSETRAKIAEMKAELKTLEDEAKGTEQYIAQVLEQLGVETRRMDNITVTVKKKNEGGRASYKDSFLYLYNKVNADLQRLADDFLDSTKGDVWVKTYLKIEAKHPGQAKAQLSEGIMKRVLDAIKGFAANVMGRLQGISGDIDQLEDMEKAQTEAVQVRAADLMIEAALKEL